MVSGLVKVVLIALSILVGKGSGKRITDGEGREARPEALRDPATEWARTLDLLFSFGLIGSIAWYSGLLRVGPLKSRGYEAYGELITLLLLFGFKCAIFVGLPAILLYILLRSVQGLGVRIVIYGLIGLGGLGISHIAKLGEAKQAGVKAEAEVVRRESEDRLQREARSMEDARELAAVKEAEEHDRLVARLVELTVEVHARWQQDLHAVGAVGLEGDKPPMLSITQETPTEWKVTNLASKKVCLKMARVLRQPGGYDRCPHDLKGECQSIGPRHTATVLLLPAGEEACRRGLVEYRVGSPLYPEPSWWSASALSSLDPRADHYREKYSHMTSIDLRTEEARLDNILGDLGRVERWKRERR